MDIYSYKYILKYVEKRGKEEKKLIKKASTRPLDATATAARPIMGDPQWGALGETRAMEAYKGRQGPIIIYMHTKTH